MLRKFSIAIAGILLLPGLAAAAQSPWASTAQNCYSPVAPGRSEASATFPMRAECYPPVAAGRTVAPAGASAGTGAAGHVESRTPAIRGRGEEGHMRGGLD